jgi:hypothetical protein
MFMEDWRDLNVGLLLSLVVSIGFWTAIVYALTTII